MGFASSFRFLPTFFLFFLYGPVTMNSAEEQTPMELDAIQKEEEESGEESEGGSEEEVDNVLFFMAPNHDKLRSREEIDATDYWEAGIKANCPARKNLYKIPWTKILMPQEKRATAQKGF